MSIWNLTISVICLLLVIVMFRREILRKNRHWIGLRCFASLLTVLGLAGMGFQREKSDKDDKRGSAGMMTADTVSQKKKTGFRDIHWSAVLKSGQPLIVQGRFMNARFSSVSIRLNGFGAVLDSVKVLPGENLAFTLQTIPKQTGKAVYRLVVNEAGNTPETEPLPVVVQPPQLLKLLILSSYPDFENKFLGQWLSGNHISVTRRTRISRDRFEKTFINRPAFEFTRITDTLLKSFDLLICDVSSLASLTEAEQVSIRRQVNEQGMGLMIRADSVQDKKAGYNSFFPLYFFPVKSHSVRKLYTPDSTRSLACPESKDGIGIRFRPGTQPLIMENGGQIRVSSRMYGKGKLVFSTIGNTFEWNLSGRNTDYGWFWTWLIQKSAKEQEESIHWWTGEKFPTRNHPVHFTLETREANTVDPTVGGVAFHLRQQKNLSSLWEGRFWPEQSGWQPALHAGKQYFEWYVFDSADWPGFATPEIQPSPAKEQKKPKGSILLFFIIYMSGWCFLWLERKLSLI